MVPKAGLVGLLAWGAFAVHLAASSSLLRRGASSHSGSLALLLRWPASTCSHPVFRPLGGLQVAHYDGQEADRRVDHVGQLVAQPEPSGRDCSRVSEASVFSMSRLSPLVLRITNLKISTITPTICRSFQLQPPQHQPNSYRPSLHAPRWSGSFHRPMCTLKSTSHSRSTTPGSGLPTSPGPFTGGQNEVAPVITTSTAVRRIRRGMGAVSLTREKWEAARGSQPAHLAPSVSCAVDTPTGHLEIHKLGSCVVETSSCSAPLYDAKLAVKLQEATPPARPPSIPTTTTSVTSSAALPPHRAENPGRGLSAP